MSIFFLRLQGVMVGVFLFLSTLWSMNLFAASPVVEGTANFDGCVHPEFRFTTENTVVLGELDWLSPEPVFRAYDAMVHYVDWAYDTRNVNNYVPYAPYLYIEDDKNGYFSLKFPNPDPGNYPAHFRKIGLERPEATFYGNTPSSMTIFGEIIASGIGCPQANWTQSSTATLSYKFWTLRSATPIEIAWQEQKSLDLTDFPFNVRPLKLNIDQQAIISVKTRDHVYGVIDPYAADDPWEYWYALKINELSSSALNVSFTNSIDSGSYETAVETDIDGHYNIQYFSLTPGEYWFFPHESYLQFTLEEGESLPWMIYTVEFDCLTCSRLHLQESPGNHTYSQPGVIADPSAPFDALHFKLALDEGYDESVEINWMEILLEGSEVIENLMSGILYTDPNCDGGQGEQLALNGDFSENLFVFYLDNFVMVQGDSKCFTAVLTPHHLDMETCRCSTIGASIRGYNVDAQTQSGKGITAAGNEISSRRVLLPAELVTTGQTAITTSPFETVTLNVDLEPPLCISQWSALARVTSVPAPGTEFYGFVDPDDGLVKKELTLPFAGNSPHLTFSFAVGDWAGLYKIELIPQCGDCPETVQFEPLVFAITAEQLPIVVNSTGDGRDEWDDDGVCFTGTFIDMNVPECTLIAAIQEANNRPGNDTITFDLPSAVNGKILLSQWEYEFLDPLVCPAAIDGTTQPGTGMVTIDGKDGLLAHGISLEGNGCLLTGLDVRNFRTDGISSTGDIRLSGVVSSYNGHYGVYAEGDIVVEGTGNRFMGNGNNPNNSTDEDALHTKNGHVTVSNAIIDENDGYGIRQEEAPSLLSGSSIDGGSLSGNKKGGAFFKEPLTVSGADVIGNGGSGLVATKISAIGTEVSKNTAWGVESTYYGVDLKACTIEENTNGGVTLHAGDTVPAADPEGASYISWSTIRNNDQEGISYTYGPALEIRDSSIVNNGAYGVWNDHGEIWVDARYNWWGSPDGPGGVGTGLGDEISERVLTEFFKTEKLPVGIVPEQNPVVVEPNVLKEIVLYVTNASDPEGTVSVSWSDPKGWIQNAAPLDVLLSNGVGEVTISVLAPVETQGNNEVLFTATGDNAEDGSATVVLFTLLKGDFNCNGYLDLADAVIILQILTGKPYTPENGCSLVLRDVNGNGKVDLADIIFLLKEIVAK